MLDFPGYLWFFAVFYLIKMFNLKIAAPDQQDSRTCTGPKVNSQWKFNRLRDLAQKRILDDTFRSIGHYRSFMIV